MAAIGTMLSAAATPAMASFVGSPYDVQLDARLADDPTVEAHFGRVTFDGVAEVLPADPSRRRRSRAATSALSSR